MLLDQHNNSPGFFDESLPGRKLCLTSQARHCGNKIKKVLIKAILEQGIQFNESLRTFKWR